MESPAPTPKLTLVIGDRFPAPSLAWTCSVCSPSPGLMLPVLAVPLHGDQVPSSRRHWYCATSLEVSASVQESVAPCADQELAA